MVSMISIRIRPTFLAVAVLFVVLVVTRAAIVPQQQQLSTVVRSGETTLSFRSLGSSRPDDSIRYLQNVTDDNIDVQNNVTADDVQCRNDSDKFLDANPSIREGLENNDDPILEQLIAPINGAVVALYMIFLPGPMHATGPICQDAGGILAKSGEWEFQCVLDEATLVQLELGNATVNADYVYLNNFEACFANTEACNNIQSSGSLLSSYFEASLGWDCKAITEVGYDFDDMSSAKKDDPRSWSVLQSAGTRHHPWTVRTLAALLAIPAAAGIAVTAL